ncbi:hypothetical protein INT45_014290 [Circinella minor]|uniref:Uncharacterized protein n=1 Tax=Circinella minor TaxID=1195481 RepID=A0A8H7VI74_9FUNG|nr:hypothetical protein INT45_014290 [Circinella minor]
MPIRIRSCGCGSDERIADEMNNPSVTVMALSPPPPISLNAFTYLPKKPPKEQRHQQYWNRIWPQLCEALYKIDFNCHPNEDFTNSNDPDPGRLFLNWIKSASDPPPFSLTSTIAPATTDTIDTTITAPVVPHHKVN